MPCPYNTRPTIGIRFMGIPIIGIWFATADHDDGVKVVRHDHESIKRYVREMLRDGGPACSNGSPGISQKHMRVAHRAKQHGPVVRANRHEVRAFSTIVVFPKTD